MKFTFYGMWEDERAKLNELQKKYAFECVSTSEEISPTNIGLSEGSIGVSLLGKGRVDEKFSSLFPRGESVFFPLAVSAITISI